MQNVSLYFVVRAAILLTLVLKCRCQKKAAYECLMTDFFDPGTLGWLECDCIRINIGYKIKCNHTGEPVELRKSRKRMNLSWIRKPALVTIVRVWQPSSCQSPHQNKQIITWPGSMSLHFLLSVKAQISCSCLCCNCRNSDSCALLGHL